MCQTNIYIDRYPDGKEVSFHQTQLCQYGQPGRPCQKHSILSNPIRKIQFGEPTTEFMMSAGPHHLHTQHQQPRVQFPNTPPRSRGRDSLREDSPTPILRRHSKRQSAVVLPALKPHREHRKERIVIVDSPPTPRTPPMHFNRPQVFTAPSSPGTPPFAEHRERGRPIIVDERGGPLRRDPSMTTNVGERVTERLTANTTRRRNRSLDRGVFQWDSPSSSHTSFDSRARREAEETERRDRARREAEEQERRERRERAEEAERRDRERAEEAERKERRERELAALEASRRLEARIRSQDEEIRRRPPIPIPASPLRRRESTRTPVVEQAPTRVNVNVTVRESGAAARLTAGELALAEEAEIRRRMEARDREAKLAREEREEREERERDVDVLKRLRERQMPKRRFSVGPGGRRHRVLYDDGVYRWE